MATRLALIRQDDFTGGLNFRADQFQLAPNESPRMLNVEIDPRGGIFSRGAMRRINSTAVSGTWSPRSLYPHYGTSAQAILANNNKIAWSTGGNFNYIQYNEGTATDVPTTQTGGASCATWEGKLYVACGAGTRSVRWTGTSTSDYATRLTANGPTWQVLTSPTGGYMPTANLICNHAGKLWVANTREDGVDKPNRVRYSIEGRPEDWDFDEYIDVVEGGNGITAIVPFAGQLLIFKQRSIWVILGYDAGSFQLVELTRNLGVDNHNHAVVTDYGVFFYSNPDGLFYYDGKTINDVFEPIRPAVATGRINPAQIDKVRVNYINRRIWLSLPYDESAPNVSKNIFVFDPTIGSRGAYMMFQTSDGYGGAGGCTLNVTGGALHLMVHPNQARVLEVDKNTYSKDLIVTDEQAFASYYRTRWHDGGNYVLRKMWRRPEIVAKQGGAGTVIGVKVYHDFEEAAGNQQKEFTLDATTAVTGFTWGTSLWGAGTWGASPVGAQIVTGKNLGFTKCVQVEFQGPQNTSNAYTGVSWGVDSITFKYTPRKVKG